MYGDPPDAWSLGRISVCRQPTAVGNAMTVLSAGWASRAPTIVATALNVTFPSVASACV